MKSFANMCERELFELFFSDEIPLHIKNVIIVIVIN